MISRIAHSKKTAIGWTIAIFILLMLPGGSIHNAGLLGLPHLDKLAHFIFFGAFVVFWYLTLAKDTVPEQRPLLAGQLFLVSAIYGTSMEFMQGLFTNRNFEVMDILADTAGAGVAWTWLRTGMKKPLWK